MNDPVTWKHNYAATFPCSPGRLQGEPPGTQSAKEWGWSSRDVEIAQNPGLEHRFQGRLQLIQEMLSAIMDAMSAKRRTEFLSRTQATRGDLIFIGAVTLLALVLRFYRIGEKSIWLDEAFSLWIARHPLWEGLGWLIRIDQHPPLYYSLLHVWTELFGELQGPVRMLSALFSTAAVPLFYSAARRLLDRTSAAIAAGILATSPFHVQFAQETRMYALLTLEAACLLFFLSRLLTERRPSTGCWVGLAASQAAVMLTHNAAAVYFPLALNAAMGILFLLPSFSLWTGRIAQDLEAAPDGPVGVRESSKSPDNASTDRDSFVSSWVKYQGLAFLLWLPWAMPFIIQILDVEQGFWLPPPWPKLVLDTFRNFHFAFLGSDFPVRPLWIWSYPVFAFAGLAGLLLTKPSARDGQPRQPAERDPGPDRGESHLTWPGRAGTAVLLACLFAVPHLIGLLVSLRSPVYAERPLIWTTLPYYLLIAAGIRFLGGPSLTRLWLALRRASERASAVSRGKNVALLDAARSAAQLFVLLAIVTLSGFCLHGYYFFFPKEGWDEAAAYIAEQAEPGDLVLFNATWVQVPFEYYFKRFGLETELRGLPVDLFERGQLEPTMEESDAPRVQEVLAGRERVWLIYSHNWYSDPDGIVPREMGSLFQEVEQAQFVGIQINRYVSRK